MVRLPNDGRLPPVFTDDECQVILLRGEGKANGDIAEALHGSKTWVDNRLRRISTKLELEGSRTHGARMP
jgi:DNA-binding NarL/FixJ family response regulator